MKQTKENNSSSSETAQASERRATELVSKMSLEEKISQMVYPAPAIEELGVPEYNWWNECLHGVGRAGVATVFPQAIGLAATWNPELMGAVATVISDEARAKHHEALRRGMRGIYTGLTFWSPNVNIFRDPRWGRGQETYGEDPYLSAAMGVAFVKGLQGEHPQYLKLVATPKHFAVHSGPESERHHFDARVDERDLRETYLPAFEACIREGHAASIMGAYNRLNGEPCCASETLLEKILRQEWGFQGYVVSDCGAITDIFAHHKVVRNAAQASALAVSKGCDLDCGDAYGALLEAVADGLISEAEVTRAVERLFTARFRLGMFDPPEEVPFSKIPYEMIDAPMHYDLALQAARQSIVLLKNDGEVLPLSKGLHSVAVIGPNANELASLLGNYNGTPRAPITPLEGIRSKLSPETQLYFAPGCEIAPGVPTLTPVSPQYLRPDKPVEGHGLRAAYYGAPDFAGAPIREQVDPCVDFVWKDSSPISGKWGDVFAVRWSGYLDPPVSGKYSLGVSGLSAYRLYLDGKCILEYNDIHHPVLKTKEIKLIGGRAYKIRLDYVNRGLDPQVRLLWATPGRDERDEALDIARKAEVIVMVMGLSPALEGEEMPVHVSGFAGGDRTDIGLPSSQMTLLQEVQALGKPLVLVLLNGSALGIHWVAEHIPAIIEAWYPGQAGGQAIADVLFGDYNPAGRLPVTFYKCTEDLPAFDDYNMVGRTYRYFQGDPLFAFGHGLSYTRFDYQDIRASSARICPGEAVTISCQVSNTGGCRGDEVVQLYLRHRGGLEPIPMKELKGFTRLSLDPGESKRVAFTLEAMQFRRYHQQLGWQVFPGKLEVMIGGASDRLPLRTRIELTGAAVPADHPDSFFSQVDIE